MPSRSTIEVIKADKNQNNLAYGLIVVILLAIDPNPVKVIAASLGIPSRWFAYPCLVMLGHLFLTHSQEFLYDGVRVFFRSILSIFFRQVDIVGIDNIPKHGPVIFSGNHSNQFVDGIMVLTTAQHRVGFLIAEKSYNHPVVGTFAKLAGAVPVTRPQDSAKLMQGTIVMSGRSVKGQETAFIRELVPGDKLRLKGSADQFKVESITSDTELTLSENGPLPPPSPTPASPFEKLGKVDQSRVYNAVFEHLKHGKCIGIFPEGGSHDRTDLLPLKVGIALIACGMVDKYNITVPIVPVGLNYFRGHRFRGRVVVEFGPPIRVPEELAELYKTNRREAYHQFLTNVEEGMRATLVTAPDYHALHLVYTARRLFQKDNWIPSPQEKMDLNRRFAEGYKILMNKYGDHRPAALVELERRLNDYQKTLHTLGLRDYQVPTLEQDDYLKLCYTIAHLFLVLTLAMMPSLVLNAPVGLIARIVSSREQKKALAASRVKIEARDVVMSKKITLSIVLVPTLWIVYAILLLRYTSLQPSTVAVLFFSCPLFSYLGVMATEAGMVDAKDLKPVVMRLSPGARKKMATLPAERAQLQREIRAYIHQIGPELGSLYTDKTVKWEEYVRKSSSAADLQSLLNEATQTKMQGSPTAGGNEGGGGGGEGGGRGARSLSHNSPKLSHATDGRETPPPIRMTQNPLATGKKDA
ncbi:glycerol-3-phosphate o-acyltransferase [Nannochloropsis oceanica]